MKSLVELAKANTTNLDQIVNNWPNQAWAGSFIKAVRQHYALSTNVRLKYINLVLESGYLKDVYQLISEEQEAKRAAGKPVPSTNKLAHEKMGDFAPKRKAFTDFFEDAKAYIYAALNLGNGGALKYGHFCLHYKPAPEKHRWVFFEKDSLTYFKEPGKELEFDWATFTQQIGAEDYAGHLALQKHGEELEKQGSRKEWANIINPPEEENVYIEALVMNGPVSIDSVTQLHIDDVEMEAYLDDLYASGGISGLRNLPPTAIQELETYPRLVANCLNLEIEIDLAENEL